MRSMRRLAVIALLLAAVTVAEPVLHNCPLTVDGPNVCTLCANAIAPVGVSRPVVVPTLTVAYQLVAVVEVGHSFDSPLVLPSRAPPAL